LVSRRFRVVSLSLLLAGVAALCAGAARPAGAVPFAEPRVDIVKVQGVIDRAQAGYVRGAIIAAERSRSTVILQLDSLGSYGDQAERLAPFIRRSTVPVIAWIGPSGARVAGGSVLVAFAARPVAMAPGAGLGPVRPPDLGEANGRLTPADSSLLGRLVPNGHGDLVVRLKSGPAFPAGPALDGHLVTFVSPTIPDLLRKLDGTPVHTSSGDVALRTLNRPGQAVAVEFHEIGVWRRILHGVSTPGAVYVLLVLGVMAIAFELTQPAFGVAGIAGAGALALAGYGLAVVPVHWLGVALILGGMALLGLDVLIRRVAVLTVLGTVAFGFGSAMAWHGVAEPIRVGGWFIGLATAATFLFFGFVLTVALRSRERIRSAQVGLVGLVGEVRTDLDPEGGVYVKGTLWRARSNDGRIPKGTRVRIRGVDGLILRVEQEPETPDS
jgi:membrane-bound serine protease (ClpP class)